MNKNKKRLSKLLVPMLAVSGMNVNAMENVKSTVRSKSFSKKRNSIRMSPGGVTLLKNKKLGNAKKKSKKTIIIFSGPAYRDVLNEYELVDAQPISNHLTIEAPIKTIGESGNEGTVTKYRDKKNNDFFAVKCESSKLLKKKLKSRGFDFFIAYKSDKYNFSSRRWAVPQIARYTDDKTAYTISKWIDGQVLDDWYEDLKKEKNLALKMKKIANVARQLNDYLTDVSSQNLEDLDLHEKNVMITPDGTVKVIEATCLVNTNSIDLEEINAYRLGRILSGAMDALNPFDNFKLLKRIPPILRNINYSLVRTAKGITKTELRRKIKFQYTSEKRNQVVSMLEELANELQHQQ